MRRVLGWLWSWFRLHFTIFRAASTFIPAKPTPTRLYIWRSHRKGMPRHFKVREVPWFGAVKL